MDIPPPPPPPLPFLYETLIREVEHNQDVHPSIAAAIQWVRLGGGGGGGGGGNNEI